jgi:hypothetical protein
MFSMKIYEGLTKAINKSGAKFNDHFCIKNLEKRKTYLTISFTSKFRESKTYFSQPNVVLVFHTKETELLHDLFQLMQELCRCSIYANNQLTEGTTQSRHSGV